MKRRLLFVIGASGAGKTAAVATLAARNLDGVSCFHFDSIGVPGADEMTRVHGSPERRQEAMTHEWIARLREHHDPFVVLEGQTRPSFIRRVEPVVSIVLLDCDPIVRGRRLRQGRAQPELDTTQMQHWAAYLRGQADALGLPVIDTTTLSPDQVADEIYATFVSSR